MPLPALYERMYDQAVFTTREAAAALDLDGPPLHEKISRLIAQGYVQPVRRGLYAVTPLHRRGEEPIVNPYLVGARLAQPYMLAYHTALELHGAAHSTFHLVLVASPVSFRTFTHQGLTYRRVSAPMQEIEKGLTSIVVEDQAVNVAKREWALVHCARRLDLCGGLEELMRSIATFPSLDMNEIKTSLETLGYATLYNRVGFIISQNRHQWGLAESELASLRKKSSAHRLYFGSKAGGGGASADHVLVRDWNVIVPRHLAEGEPDAGDAA